MKLNPDQTEAVKYIDGPLLVLAGAGSGKTRVIIEKINYLIAHCGFSARHIFAVTFTNKAAREMRERISLSIKGGRARGLKISTFHTLGLKIIREEHGILGLKSGFSIFDDQDIKALLGELMHQECEDDKIAVEDVQYRISGWKNALISSSQAVAKCTDSKDMLAAVIYERYCHTMKTYNAVDFDDLILLPVNLFRSHSDRLEKWQNRVHYLLVDECQDTNNAQYELIKQLIGMHAKCTLVGDDDQSIYAWRGARPENMAALKNDYPGLYVVKLEQNYRSTRRILKAANQLIANNTHVFDKKLWSDLGMGDEIRVIQCSNEGEEAERIATEILTHRLRHQTRYNDYAVLYRSNHQARLIELKLQEHQVPYFITGGISFFSRAEVKDVMAYLRLLGNPDDDNAFLRIINTPRREIGVSTLEKLGAYTSQRHISLYQGCSELGLEQALDKRHVEKLRLFVNWMDTLRQDCHANDPGQVVQGMLDIIGYRHWLESQCSNSAVANKRMRNVEILLDSIGRSLEKTDEDLNGEERLKETIAKLMLQDLLERQEDEEDEDRVQMLTLHASKGLEFPYVFMAGIEEDILPHRNSVEEDSVDEERRLMYVGITRAQKNLTLTMASERRQYGENVTSVPSRFIDEMPQEDIVYDGTACENSCEEEQQEKGNEMLSLLKDSLDLL